VDDCKPEHWHGTVNGYSNRKCRCSDCRKAWAAQVQQAKLRRMADRVEVNGRLVHPTAPHGTANAYGNYGCRCWPCTDKWVADVTARRKARVA
jgi:hypothetical protein